MEKNRVDEHYRCWTYFGCPNLMKSRCKAFSEDKIECWLINLLKPGPRSKDQDDCFNCDWYKMNNTIESKNKYHL